MRTLSLLTHRRPPVSRSHVRRIGAGTGIFTRALLAHPEWAGAVGALRAVEPSEGMRAQFAKTVPDARVSVHEGTFDATAAPDGWADLVVIAQVRVALCDVSLREADACAGVPLVPGLRRCGARVRARAQAGRRRRADLEPRGPVRALFPSPKITTR